MKRLSSLPLTLLFVSAAAFAQTSPTDSDTLKALLTEVRQLRQDLRTTTIAAQREQVLIYRAQAQESIVRRMQERVDDTRSKLAQVRSEQKRRAASIKQIEEKRTETPASEQKDFEDTVTQLRARFDADANIEQEIQTTLIDAEEQLRMEQAKLGGLQDQLDRLEKLLESFDRQK